MNSETVIVGIVTAVLTYLGTRTQGKYNVKRQEVESETNSEGMYVENMSVILAEYKDQVSGFRDEVKQLREDNEAIKKEFEEFRKSSEQKMDEYKKYVDLLETENEELKEENAELKLEVSYLKGANHEIKQ